MNRTAYLEDIIGVQRPMETSMCKRGHLGRRSDGCRRRAHAGCGYVVRCFTLPPAVVPLLMWAVVRMSPTWEQCPLFITMAGCLLTIPPFPSMKNGASSFMSQQTLGIPSGDGF
ncbi:hypothetical protein OF83DRAFT_930077 [Amylostereum chailletii]|nr:hypothetical protein OF83DRAFT_930077 [Amylostereum chailletii]